MDLSDVSWRKSSYSGSQGACVEVGVAWRKSSYSTSNGSCVEVASGPADAVAVRDSKDPLGPALTFPPDQWRAFTRRIKAGELDLS